MNKATNLNNVALASLVDYLQAGFKLNSENLIRIEAYLVDRINNNLPAVFESLEFPPSDFDYEYNILKRKS